MDNVGWHSNDDDDDDDQEVDDNGKSLQYQLLSTKALINLFTHIFYITLYAYKTYFSFSTYFCVCVFLRW